MAMVDRLINRAVSAEVEYIKSVLTQAGGNPGALDSMSARELIDTCVRNDIHFTFEYLGGQEE